jgi:hypothetical protein
MTRRGGDEQRSALLASGVTTLRDASGIGREAALVEHARAVKRGEADEARMARTPPTPACPHVVAPRP